MQPGLKGNPWRGMHREGNRLLPDNDQFYLLQNMRLIGGQWQGRGGQTKANAAVLSGTSVTGIYGSNQQRGTSGGDPEAVRILYQRETSPTASTSKLYFITATEFDSAAPITAQPHNYFVINGTPGANFPAEPVFAIDCTAIAAADAEIDNGTTRFDPGKAYGNVGLYSGKLYWPLSNLGASGLLDGRVVILAFDPTAETWEIAMDFQAYALGGLQTVQAPALALADATGVGDVLAIMVLGNRAPISNNEPRLYHWDGTTLTFVRQLTRRYSGYGVPQIHTNGDNTIVTWLLKVLGSGNDFTLFNVDMTSGIETALTLPDGAYDFNSANNVTLGFWFEYGGELFCYGQGRDSGLVSLRLVYKVLLSSVTIEYTFPDLLTTLREPGIEFNGYLYFMCHTGGGATRRDYLGRWDGAASWDLTYLEVTSLGGASSEIWNLGGVVDDNLLMYKTVGGEYTVKFAVSDGVDTLTWDSYYPISGTTPTGYPVPVLGGGKGGYVYIGS